MASSRHGGGGANQQPAPAQEEFDPTYEWQENAANFVLRLRLAGFRKEDFRVQVDGAGRLTVRGQGHDSRFHKVFQLPATSNLDDVTGRFEAGVLTITVPKRRAASATTTDDKQQLQVKPNPNPKEDAVEDANNNKAADADHQTKSSRPQPHHQHGDGEAKATKEEQQEDDVAAEPKVKDDKAPPPPPSAVRKEEGKPKPTTTTTAVPAAQTDKTKQAPQPHRGQRPAPAPEERRHCRWQEELEGLAASEWAQGLLDTAKKNKDVIAAAVAAFSLGLFVSSRIFSRN